MASPPLLPKMAALSERAMLLKLFFNETPLSTATGFIWRRQDLLCLVTNWHVVSGKNQETGKHLNPETAAEPNRLQWSNALRPGLNVPLRDSDGEPVWWVHPKYRSTVDIAVVPLARMADLPQVKQTIAINDLKLVTAEYGVGDDVFAIGYPLGASTRMPIWKRASIASEPHWRSDSEPILIDTATRPGMSGSPVVWRDDKVASPDGSIAMYSGKQSMLIGIYSGRVATKDLFEAQIGRVWQTSLIEETIDGQMRDTL